MDASQTTQVTEVLSLIEWRGWLNIVINVIGAIGVVVSIFVSLRNRGHITELKIRINGRMEELMDTARRLAEAEGKLIGQAEKLKEHVQTIIIEDPHK